MKVTENIDDYLQKKLWNMKVKVIPVAVDASEGLKIWLEGLEIRERIETV